MTNRWRYPYFITGIFFIKIFILFGCDSSTNREKNKVGSVEEDSFREQTKSEKKDSIIISDEVKSEVRKIRLNKDIRILSFEKKSEVTSIGTYNDCSKWNLDANTIKELLLNLPEIDEHNWHYSYLVLGCTIEGELLVETDTLKFEINSGSWLNIFYPDTVIRYGDENGKYKNWFMESKSSVKGSRN